MSLHRTPVTSVKPRSPGADFADYCCELLGGLGPCVAKRMFGGWGISVDDLTVAIIAWDTLYLKTNADTAAQWVAAGCEQFLYEAKGKRMQMHYYTVPEAALESRAAMQPWAQLALQAALAARRGAVAKKKPAVAKVGAAKAAKGKTGKAARVK